MSSTAILTAPPPLGACPLALRPSPFAVAVAQRASDAGLPRRVAAASSASANTRASASAQATTPRSTHQHDPDDAHTARSPLRAPDAGVARRQVAAASSIAACIDHGTHAPPCERDDGAGASENQPTRPNDAHAPRSHCPSLPAPFPCTARVTVKGRRDGVGCTYAGTVYAVVSIIRSTILYTCTCTRS